MIQAISSYLPDQRLTNDDLVQIFPEWTSEKIYAKTGIRERRLTGKNEFASDLAFQAAERLLSKMDRPEVDFLLLCTQSPDYLLPTTACVLQHRLQLPTRCGALDFNLGCSGFVYGLALADSLIQARHSKSVLLINADTYTKFLDPSDRGTRAIFGDAATATLLTERSKNRLHAFVFGTDGSGAEQLIYKGSAARPKACSKDYLFMNGPEIFNFTNRSIPDLVAEVLRKGGKTLESIDLFIFHQANAFMLEHLRRRLRIPEEKFVLCLEDRGNTVSATIPLALETVIEQGRLRPDMTVLLAGFGVGFSWGGCILEWNQE